VTHLLEGIAVDSFKTAMIAALGLGLANAVIRPILVMLTLPLTILTLGLFLLVLNGAMLYLVAYLVEGFQIRSFFDAVIAAVVIWIISFVMEMIVNRE
jgi:putative membrane protein